MNKLKKRQEIFPKYAEHNSSVIMETLDNLVQHLLKSQKQINNYENNVGQNLKNMRDQLLNKEEKLKELYQLNEREHRQRELDQLKINHYEDMIKKYNNHNMNPLSPQPIRKKRVRLTNNNYYHQQQQQQQQQQRHFNACNKQNKQRLYQKQFQQPQNSQNESDVEMEYYEDHSENNDNENLDGDDDEDYITEEEENNNFINKRTSSKNRETSIKRKIKPQKKSLYDW